MTTARALLKHSSVALGSIGPAALLYSLLLRRPILNWGATDTEAHARLPDDELLEEADGVATRAITIDAPASTVWPWIAQMSCGISAGCGAGAARELRPRNGLFKGKEADDGTRTHDLLHGKRVARRAWRGLRTAWLSGKSRSRAVGRQCLYHRRLPAIPPDLGTGT